MGRVLLTIVLVIEASLARADGLYISRFVEYIEEEARELAGSFG